MLSLDDKRWGELELRNGSASNLPDKLRCLLNNPSNDDIFPDLWPELCSEDTAWSAAYASVPYIYEIAKKRPPDNRVEHLFFIGYVVMSTGKDSHIPQYLIRAYKEAVDKTLSLISESLSFRHDKDQTRYLLSACAALMDHVKLGKVICNINFGCPHCGEDILHI